MLHVHELLAKAGQVGDGDGDGDGAGGGDGPPRARLTLTFDDRRRSRLLARLDDGREVALRLPRGTVLRHGDLLRADEDHLVIEVRAAAEHLSVGATSDAHLLTRAAYHLGNRHVPLQIAPGWVAYAHDHVLDDLARGLGLDVSARVAPFEPELGAFQHDGAQHQHHHHDHDHNHRHHHHHDHDHDHTDGGRHHD
jgi:urease accessory protein